MTIFLLEDIKNHIFKSVATVMGAIAGFGFGCFGSIVSYEDAIYKEAKYDIYKDAIYDIDEESNKGITAILAVETFLSIG